MVSVVYHFTTGIRFFQGKHGHTLVPQAPLKRYTAIPGTRSTRNLHRHCSLKNLLLYRGLRPCCIMYSKPPQHVMSNSSVLAVTVPYFQSLDTHITFYIHHTNSYLRSRHFRLLTWAVVWIRWTISWACTWAGLARLKVFPLKYRKKEKGSRFYLKCIAIWQ